jgi:lipopolysaccharide export system permease protein
MRVLTHLERYVMLRTLAMVGAALAVIALVVLLIDFVELSRDVGARAEVSFVQVLGLTLMKSPSTILILLPFVFLFGVLAAFVALNRRSELIAMRAAGVSAWRFIFPAAAAAFAIGVLVVTVVNPLVAVANAQFEDVRGRMLSGYLAENKAEDVWLRQGDENTQIVIRAGSRDPSGAILRDVTMLVYTVIEDGPPVFARRIEAREARLADGQWRLTDVREAMPGQTAVRAAALSIPTNLDPRWALEAQAAPQTVPFWSLPGRIAQVEQAGFSATNYRIQFQQLLATPLMFAAMAILAAGFSLRLLRLGGLAGLAGAGVALGFVFFFFAQLCGALGRADVITPFFAAWIPPLLAILTGFTLLCYTEDG